jgi:uncharacterized protein (TIGR02271 family)
MAQHIVDSEGLQAALESLDAQEARLRFEDGQLITVPSSSLIAQEDGSYRVDFSLTRFSQDGVMVIPLVAEDVRLDKQEVRRQVRVTKTVKPQDVNLNAELHQEDVDIEHVEINRYVDEPLSVRYEGDTTIIPLVEEVLVVEKRLLLREEIRVTRRKYTREYSQVYTLRREDVHVEREDESSE